MWLTLVVMALILGPRVRVDELLFALCLPLAVLVPYEMERAKSSSAAR